MNNHISASSDYDGLAIRGGRLINERYGNCKTGIQKIAEAKKAMHEEREIAMRTQAHVRGVRQIELENDIESMSKRGY